MIPFGVILNREKKIKILSCVNVTESKIKQTRQPHSLTTVYKIFEWSREMFIMLIFLRVKVSLSQ